MSQPVSLVIDFDGTAATSNVGMALIEKFAIDDSWRVIDDDYLNGKVGSKGAFELLGPLMTGTAEDWREFINEGHALDPSLGKLVELALEERWEVEILSDGLDFYIHEMLGKEGIDIPVRAASATPCKGEGGGARIEMNFSGTLCTMCGTCKKDRLKELADNGRHVIFIGDGLSDRCAAPTAHRIFAKDILARHLEEHGQTFEEFTTLEDVAEALFGPRAKGR